MTVEDSLSLRVVSHKGSICRARASCINSSFFQCSHRFIKLLSPYYHYALQLLGSKLSDIMQCTQRHTKLLIASTVDVNLAIYLSVLTNVTFSQIERYVDQDDCHELIIFDIKADVHACKQSGLGYITLS